MDTSVSPNPSAEIASLDADKDCERIAFLLTYQLFPFTIEKSLEYALFKTYAVPSISRILAATGEFTERAQKRYDDTVLVLAEIGENGAEHDNAKAAYARMNEMHGRFKIRNEDFLYTLSTFIFEPIRALKLYGPRPMTEHEAQAWFNAYVKLGDGMGIRELPTDLESFKSWREAFERTDMRFEPSNRKVADATMKVLFDMLMVPGFMRGFGERATVALMEPHVAEAFGYQKPSSLMKASMDSLMALRRVVASMLPDNKSLRLQSKRSLPTYPGGYEIAKLGTFASEAAE